MLRAILLVALVAAVSSEQIRFDNYKMYRAKPTTEKQLEALKLFKKSQAAISMQSPQKNNVEVSAIVPPHKQPEFEDFLSRYNISSRLTISDIQKKIDDEKRVQKDSFGWTAYYPLNEINAWLTSLAEQYPQVSKVVGGKSYEGRDITGVKVSFKDGNPAVFIESGIHANEWIGPATSTYVLNQVLTSNDSNVRAIVEAYDWYVFPSFNPDGYVYTHTVDRTWRKTRSDSGDVCRGADPNRNWGFHWMDGGSFNDSCSIYFAGTEAFSEMEAKTMSEFLTTIKNNLKIYLAFHSYSQMLLLPYGHTNQHIINYDQLMRIGNTAAEKLKQRHGTEYQVGNIVDLLYVASGGSADWVRGTFGTPVVLTLELRDTGEFGFLLPVDQIIPSGEETFDAVISILQDSQDIDFKKKSPNDKE